MASPGPSAAPLLGGGTQAGAQGNHPSSSHSGSAGKSRVENLRCFAQVRAAGGEGRLAPRTTGTQDCPALPVPKPPTAGAPVALTVTEHKRSAASRPSAAAEVDKRQATQGEAGHPGSPPLIRPSTVLRLLLSGPTAIHFGFWKHHQMARPPQGQSTRTCRPADVHLGPWSSHHSAPQGTERRRSEHIHV